MMLWTEKLMVYFGILVCVIFAIGALTGCSKEYVPEPVLFGPGPVPAECKSIERGNLRPMPEMQKGESVEAYTARIGEVHRKNMGSYRYTKRRKDLCARWAKG